MEPPMRIRLKYVYRQRRADGKIGHRFERPGFPKTWLKSAPGTPEFIAEWSRLMKGEVAPPATRHVPQGSISWLVNQYQASAKWAGLADATRMQRRKIFRTITNQSPDVPAMALTAADMRRWRDNRASTPAAANNLLKAFSSLYAWGVEMDHVAENPVRGVKHLPMKKGGHAPWTAEDMRRFRAYWPDDSKPHLALCLLLFTACRRSDVVKLGRQHVRDGWISFRQTKTGDPVEMPMLQPLAEAIRDCHDMTFLTTQYGGPFKAESFGNWFRKVCNEAGVSKSAHGIRKAAGALLAEMGCTMSEIAAVLGHSDERTTSIYTRSAQRRVLAKSAMEKMAGFKW